jgi:hypothetical protein
MPNWRAWQYLWKYTKLLRRAHRMLLSQAERTRLGVFAIGRLWVGIAREAP